MMQVRKNYALKMSEAETIVADRKWPDIASVSAAGEARVGGGTHLDCAAVT